MFLEIANALHMFLQLLKDNNQVEFNSQLNNLPELKQWLIAPQPQRYVQQNVEDVSPFLLKTKLKTIFLLR